MRSLVILAPLALLAGCQSLGRLPGQTDVQCVRTQMKPPASWSFVAAASRCAQYTDDGSLTQIGSHLIPLNLRGAPDLQAQAAAAGYPFTT